MHTKSHFRYKYYCYTDFSIIKPLHHVALLNVLWYVSCSALFSALQDSSVA